MPRIIWHTPSATSEGLSAAIGGMVDQVLRERARQQHFDDQTQLMQTRAGIDSQARRESFNLGEQRRAGEQAFTLQRDAQNQNDRLALQQQGYGLKRKADADEERDRTAAWEKFMAANPELVGDPDAQIARMDFVQGRSLNGLLSLRARRAAEQAKAGQRQAEGEAAAGLFTTAASVPGALPAEQQGPPSPQAQAGAQENAAIERLLRTNPKMVDDPWVRQRMGMRTAGEELAIDREGRLVQQEGRLNESLNIQRQRLEMNKAGRLLTDAQKRVMRLQNELIKTPEDFTGQPNPRREQLLADLGKAEQELQAVETATAPYLTPQNPQTPGMMGQGGQAGQGGQQPAPVGEVGRTAEGLMVLQGPGGGAVALTVPEAVELRRRTAERYGGQWASMNEQQRRAAMAELAELLHSGGQ